MRGDPHSPYPPLGVRWHGLAVLARGANRLCVIDPQDPASCLKFELAAAERPPAGLRTRLRRACARRFPALGENATELRAWRRLYLRLGDAAAELFTPCLGTTASAWGPALRCGLVRESDGTPARSLYAHLFQGTSCTADALCAAVDEVECWLLRHRVPLFDLNAGNFVVTGPAGRPRLVCVDAKSTLSGKEILPVSRWSRGMMQRKIRRRAERLRRRIRDALAEPSPSH